MDSRIEEILKEKVGDPYEEVPLMSRIEVLLSRLDGDVDTSGLAHSLELSINNTTYVMTATLKNEDGDVLGSPSSIDLPLETMVVSGSYDDNTKKIILTLNNGQTIEFSVADLVSGLQSEITSQSKLASDLVDDTNQTNKFVTSSEKSTWNGKQDSLTFDNSPTENSNNPVKSGGIYTTLSGKQDTIDSSHKLSSDLVDDTDPNVNKFVTSAEKTQITTNTHDIAIIKSMLMTTFGFKINKNDMNPNTRVEYLYDAVGMNPAYMDFTNDVFSYGDWGEAWFVKDNRPVALKFDGTVDYELDHSDFTKKLDGTASDITDTAYGGNFMSEIPLCYIKRWEDSDYNYIAISDKPVDDSYKAYAHTNANGIIKPQIYLPMFKGSVVSSKLRSIAGQFPTDNTTGADEVSYAEACGSGWQLWDWSKHELIADLLTLISLSTDSKGKFGKGDINTFRDTPPDYGKQATGGYCLIVGDMSTFLVDSKGQFYGKNDDTHHVTTFYIEDFWGNRNDRCLGLNLDSGVYKVKMIPPYVLDTDSTYTTISSVSVPSTGWVKNISTGDYGGLPSQTGATETTGYCNRFYSDHSSVRLALFGGYCYNSSNYGYRCVALDYTSSASRWFNGGSPCFNL